MHKGILFGLPVLLAAAGAIWAIAVLSGQPALHGSTPEVNYTRTQETARELRTETEAESQAEAGLIPLVKAQKDLPGTIIAVIDNHPRAYPQSGLDRADRVYELLAEGNITRFLAVYHSRRADKVGPIRSARYYFAYIVKGHNAVFAHAGGNADALALIPRLKIKDLDEIYNSSEYFWRDKGRKMPHNLYSSTSLLLEGARSKGYQLVPLKPLEQGYLIGGQPAKRIEITYSMDPRYPYTVSYRWQDRVYQRFTNDKPHETLEGKQIYTENVIVLAAKTRTVVKEELQSEIEVLGQGPALFFTAGRAYKGSWRKGTAASEYEFLVEGRPMKFQGEHAWVNIVPSLDQVVIR